MARDFSKVSLNIWSSQKFEALRESDALRLLYLYILTSPHSNSAGCYNLKDGYGSSDLHWDVEAYRKAIDSLCDTGLIAFDEVDQTVWIANWVAFNEPTNAKHALGMLKDLDRAKSPALKTVRFWEYDAVIRKKRYEKDSVLGAKMHTLSIAYPKPIERVSEQLQTQTQTQTQRENQTTDPDSESSTEPREDAWNDPTSPGQGDVALPDGARRPGAGNGEKEDSAGWRRHTSPDSHETVETPVVENTTNHESLSSRSRRHPDTVGPLHHASLLSSRLITSMKLTR